jgi:hypothetical protein
MTERETIRMLVVFSVLGCGPETVPVIPGLDGTYHVSLSHVSLSPEVYRSCKSGTTDCRRLPVVLSDYVEQHCANVCIGTQCGVVACIDAG